MVAIGALALVGAGIFGGGAMAIEYHKLPLSAWIESREMKLSSKALKAERLAILMSRAEVSMDLKRFGSGISATIGWIGEDSAEFSQGMLINKVQDVLLNVCGIERRALLFSTIEGH